MVDSTKLRRDPTVPSVRGRTTAGSCSSSAGFPNPLQGEVVKFPWGFHEEAEVEKCLRA